MTPQTVMQQRANVLVVALVGKSLAEEWWTSPNKAFDGQVPRLVDIKKVYDYLMSHAQGGY